MGSWTRLCRRLRMASKVRATKIDPLFELRRYVVHMGSHVVYRRTVMVPYDKHLEIILDLREVFGERAEILY